MKYLKKGREIFPALSFKSMGSGLYGLLLKPVHPKVLLYT
jgi:hypothetical protein